MVFRSTRNPKYIDFTDQDILYLIGSLEQERALMNDCDNFERVDEIDKELFNLDDEMCARGIAP